jgi:hypothetical protein
MGSLKYQMRKTKSAVRNGKTRGERCQILTHAGSRLCGKRWQKFWACVRANVASTRQ